MYADEHTEGDTGRAVRQVPHDQLLRSTFGGEGDVAHLMQFFAQMEMDEIRCVRLVSARLQGTGLDYKTLTWGASGKRAWGQNVLTGAAAERRTVVMASELQIIHPQAFLTPERAIDLNPDNKAATARVLVKLNNDMRCDPRRDGFSLLNHDAPPMLVEDVAFHKFSEMSNIGPWIDKEDKLQWDYKIKAGYRGACNVRNGRLGGAANRDALIEKEGYMINEHGKRCITGFHKLGNLNKDALIEKEGYMINEHGKRCITGFHKLGNLGGAANRDALIEQDGHMINEHGKRCITGFHNLGNLNKDALIEKEGYMINEYGKRCITGFHNLGNLTKDAIIEKEGHMINEHGKRCITGFHKLGKLSGEATIKIHAAKALDEHHTHICISALCRRGASISWQKGYPVYAHRCCDPQLSGIEGQQTKQQRGKKLHMCKKCHRTAQDCEGGDRCRVTCNTTNHKSCQHLH